MCRLATIFGGDMTSRLHKVSAICAALAFVLGVFYIAQPTYAEEQPAEVRSQSTTMLLPAMQVPPPLSASV